MDNKNYRFSKNVDRTICNSSYEQENIYNLSEALSKLDQSLNFRNGYN